MVLLLDEKGVRIKHNFSKEDIKNQSKIREYGRAQGEIDDDTSLGSPMKGSGGREVHSVRVGSR
jgi:hypothetical protein